MECARRKVRSMYFIFAIREINEMRSIYRYIPEMSFQNGCMLNTNDTNFHYLTIIPLDFFPSYVKSIFFFKPQGEHANRRLDG